MNNLLNNNQSPGMNLEPLPDKNIEAAKRRASFYTYGTLIGLVVIMIIFNFLTKNVLVSPRNLVNLFRQIATNGVLSLGMTFLIISGNIDLSVGAGVALLAVFAAVMQVWYKLGTAPAIILTLIAGLAIGLWQGFWVVRGKLPAFIVTLAGMTIYRGLALLWTDGQGISPTNPSYNIIGQGFLSANYTAVMLGVIFILWLIYSLVARRSKIKYGFKPDTFLKTFLTGLIIIVVFIGVYYVARNYEGMPVPGLILACLTVISIFIINNTTFGRAIYAIGGNKEAARLSGVKIDKIIFLNFIWMGFITAVSALILSARLQSGAGVMGQQMELDAIAACIIGGTSLNGGSGTIIGTVIGAAIMGVIDNGMSIMGMSAFWKMIIKGLVIIIAVYFDLYMKRRQRKA